MLLACEILQELLQHLNQNQGWGRLAILTIFLLLVSASGYFATMGIAIVAETSAAIHPASRQLSAVCLYFVCL